MIIIPLASECVCVGGATGVGGGDKPQHAMMTSSPPPLLLNSPNSKRKCPGDTMVPLSLYFGLAHIRTTSRQQLLFYSPGTSSQTFLCLLSGGFFAFWCATKEDADDATTFLSFLPPPRPWGRRHCMVVALSWKKK